MKRSICFVPFLSALALMLLLAGCWNPFKPPDGGGGGNPPKDEILPRTTPQNALNNLKVYYSVKDNYLTSAEEAHSVATLYREILHTDFKFYFIPGDEPSTFPEGWWGKEPEAVSLDSLLTRRALGAITDIQLSWNVGAAVPDERMTSPPPPEVPVPLHPGWMHINVNLILLDVVEGPNTREVKNGIADFYFAPDPTDTTLWVITEWWDRQPIS